MRSLDTDLFTSDTPLRFLGLEMGARMTVARLPDGRLWLHSPVRPTDELVREVEALGPVAYLVAPNRFHHLFIDAWQERFPEAETHLAPGLDTKRPDLRATAVLTNDPAPGWGGTIDQVVLDGIPFMNEVVFFHRPSKTLIATDLAFNIGDSSPWATRTFFRLGGTFGRLAPTLLERILVRNRIAFRTCLERILEWPFERIVVAHGEISEQDGRAELMRGYDWVLDGGREN